MVLRDLNATTIIHTRYRSTGSSKSGEWSRTVEHVEESILEDGSVQIRTIDRHRHGDPCQICTKAVYSATLGEILKAAEHTNRCLERIEAMMDQRP